MELYSSLTVATLEDDKKKENRSQLVIDSILLPLRKDDHYEGNENIA